MILRLSSSLRNYCSSTSLRAINVFLLILIGIGIALLLTQKSWVPKLVEYLLRDELASIQPQPIITNPHPYDGTYTIGGTEVTLMGGVSTTDAAPGSATKIITKFFGNEAHGDIDGDGIVDTTFFLTQETGGSGTFFYIAAQLNTADGIRNVDATLIGDRIAPQPIQIHDGLVLVPYADRAPGESFDVSPSIGKEIRLKLDPATMQFGEVVADFEGEADPKRMSLTMHTWTWQSAEYADGRVVTPTQAQAFTLTFTQKGAFSASTDCNGVGGTYTATDANVLTMREFMGTLMYCEGSQESTYTSLLQDVTTYHFTSRGELILGLKYDSGSMIFR